MSYESRMLADLAMPSRSNVQRALLRTLLKHGGVVKEFAAGEEVVGELADQFQLNSAQRTAALETVYRKENRLKKTLLWHRLPFSRRRYACVGWLGFPSDGDISFNWKKRMDAHRTRFRRFHRNSLTCPWILAAWAITRWSASSTMRAMEFACQVGANYIRTSIRFDGIASSSFVSNVSFGR